MCLAEKAPVIGTRKLTNSLALRNLKSPNSLSILLHLRWHPGPRQRTEA